MGENQDPQDSRVRPQSLPFMRRRVARNLFTALYFGLFVAVLASQAAGAGPLTLEADWANPPQSARLRSFWWWLNGHVTKAAITRDLEEMKAKGFGGTLLFDAGGANQDGNAPVPAGPVFGTPAWRELFRHAVGEAGKLGLELGLNIQSGWNLGGPMVRPERAAKLLVFSEARVKGPGLVENTLPQPTRALDFYRDVAVVAYPARQSTPKPIRMLAQKMSQREMGGSAPDCSVLLLDERPSPGEEACRREQVLDLSEKMNAAGVLRWEAPAGEWIVLRFGYTATGAKVSTCSQGWDGLVLDYLNAEDLRWYWRTVVEPLIADAGPLAGATLKYVATDSWECGGMNWTPAFREEFRRRRGYDLLPLLPVLAGRIVDDRQVANRFLADFRKTIGDCIVENHYLVMRELAHEHGMAIHPESGGPHGAPIDSLRCLGVSDCPMSEFWAQSWRHRTKQEERFFLKQPASAAHVYGRRLVLAEGFTTIGPHWQETIWDNLKPSFDQAICEGLNLLFWHALVCSPAEMGLPGQQYFAGAHLNPNTTWWPKSRPFFDYINRCQSMMQQGLFVADVCFYYGDSVPNFAQLKRSDPARVLPGYDYDVITEDAILTRLSVRKGRFMLPDGMSYRLLVLPERTAISLSVLRKLREFVAAGATILGPKPLEASGLEGYPQSDLEVARLARELWGKQGDATNRSGTPSRGGRVITGRTAREVLLEDGVKPDFEFAGGNPGAIIDYLHRTAEGAEIYFVASYSNRWEQVRCTFRVAGKAPEIWDAVTGRHRFATAYEERGGRTTMPLEFSPCGSRVIVFREPSEKHIASATSNSLELKTRAEVTGPWTVRFDPNWGGPESAQFKNLVSWTTRPEPGVKYYSGTAVYVRIFDLPAGLPQPGQKLWLDLGELRDLAEVRLNGKNLGTVWAPPFRVEISEAVKTSGNLLEIEVVNSWPNRIIGDARLPPAQRRTRTNIRRLTADTSLMPSGLFGPVRILAE